MGDTYNTDLRVAPPPSFGLGLFCGRGGNLAVCWSVAINEKGETVPVRFLNPNIHVILIHYPLGVFVLGVVLELLGFMWRRSIVRTAARCMIVLGALLSLPASTSGIFALHDLKRQGFDVESFEMFRKHVILMGIGTILSVVCAVLALGASDKLRRTLYIPFLLGVVASWGLMVIGAYNGGEAISRHGASVGLIKMMPVKGENGKPVLEPDGKVKKVPTLIVPDKEGRFESVGNHLLVYKTGTKVTGIMQRNTIVNDETTITLDDKPAKIDDLKPDFYLTISENHKGIATAISASSAAPQVDPVAFYGGGIIQQHMIVAGLAFAVAMGALGLALRRVSSNSLVRQVPVGANPAIPGRRGGSDDMTMLHSFNPQAQVAPAPIKSAIPSGRFWLLAALVTFAAAGLGYWQITGTDVLKPAGWTTFVDQQKPEADRITLMQGDTEVKFTVSPRAAILVSGASNKLSAVPLNKLVALQLTDKDPTGVKPQQVTSLRVIDSSTDAREGEISGTITGVSVAQKITRFFAHTILGGSMLLLTLICALLAVAAPRHGWLLGFFGLLLVAVIAAQVWMGICLTFDKGDGPLNRFKTDAERDAALVMPLEAPGQV
jgi:uncharacterized membrane protein